MKKREGDPIPNRGSFISLSKVRGPNGTFDPREKSKGTDAGVCRQGDAEKRPEERGESTERALLRGIAGKTVNHSKRQNGSHFRPRRMSRLRSRWGSRRKVYLLGRGNCSRRLSFAKMILTGKKDKGVK